VGAGIELPQHLMHQALILQRIFADQKGRQLLLNECRSRGMHEPAKLRKPDQAVVGFNFYQAHPGAQRLLEQRRCHRNVSQLG
jgi:hypothetical protein